MPSDIEREATSHTPSLIDFLDYISHAASAVQGPDWGLSLIPQELERNRVRELQSAGSLGEQAAWNGEDVPQQMQPSGGRLMQLVQSMGGPKPAARSLTPDEQSVATSAYTGIRDKLFKEEMKKLQMIQGAWDAYGPGAADVIAKKLNMQHYFPQGMPGGVGRGEKRAFDMGAGEERLRQGREGLDIRQRDSQTKQGFLGLGQESLARRSKDNVFKHLDSRYAPMLDNIDKNIAQLQKKLGGTSISKDADKGVQAQIDAWNKAKMDLIKRKNRERAPFLADELQRYGIELTPESIDLLPDGFLESLHELSLSDEEKKTENNLKLFRTPTP